MDGSVKKYDAVVIGGGPAGMMAALTMAERGAKVIIADKNKLLGKKLRITGKGRCNVTNSCDFDKLTENIISGNKFLLSSLKKFSNIDLINFLNDHGLATVEERGGRVFPASSKAFDVAELFVWLLKEIKVPVLYDFDAKKLLIKDNAITGAEGIVAGKKHVLVSDRVILATGGVTYQGTGSDGSGYLLAMQAGHSVNAPVPSLTALKCLENGDCGSMQGMTLKNTGIRLTEAGKAIFEDFGELMFTSFGITGPTVLSMSRFYIEKALEGRGIVTSAAELKPYLHFSKSIYENMNSDHRFMIELDLKPALDDSTLDKRLLTDFYKYRAKLLKNALNDLLPISIIEPVLKRTGIDIYMPVSSVSRSDRSRIINAIKHFSLTPLYPEDPDHGVVTSGGIRLSEIEPSTLASKKCRGLYFAGEIIDADGLTGGYNLTIAFSTGRAAGIGAYNQNT